MTLVPCPESNSSIENDAVRAHVEFWKARVGRRLHAYHPERPAWDRRGFLRGLWKRAPNTSPSVAVELADAFEAAIAASRGNSARFRRETADL